MVKKLTLITLILVFGLTIFSCTEDDSSPALINLSANNLNYENVLIGHTSEPLYITINNYGEEPLEIQNVTIEPAGNFMIAGDYPNTIETSGSGEISVVFTPTELMEYSATMTIKTNAGNYPYYDVMLTGASSDLDLLASWMTGDFSSEAQADTSSDPYHYPISMKMVRIWDEKTDGYWLYIEQAEIGQNPYRQRIYHVFDNNGQLMDEIFRIPNDDQYIGSWTWDDTSVFDSLTVESLEEAEGCEVYFEKQDSKFTGGTQGTDCGSSIPGVEYITSEVEVAETYMTSWDLGYDANGNIVMGPFSPYIFDKLEDWSTIYSE